MRVHSFLLVLPILAAGMTPPASCAEPRSSGQQSAQATSLKDWRTDPLSWEWKDGAIATASQGASLAFWRAVPVCRRVTVEAAIMPKEILGDEWKSAGILIYANGEAYWQLALTERPNPTSATIPTKNTSGAAAAARSFELGQRINGAWPSSKGLKQITDEKAGQWEPGQTYRLRLELAPGRIEGWVRDSKGAPLFHRVYELSEAAAQTGRPALRITGISAAFSNVAATWQEPVEESATKATAAFPPYRRVGEPSPLKGRQTGFFHVETIGGQWWIIDPAGEATVTRGVDHVTYKGSYCTALGYNPYERNNDKKYKSKEEWENQTLERLQSWGFNLLAAGSQPSLQHRGLAHAAGASLGNKFTSLGGDCEICPNEKHPGSAFPNVFHPKFREWCEYQLEEPVAAAANDPWLLGYFLDNELAWWGRRRDVTYGLFDAVMLKPAAHSAKRALRDFLKEKYGGSIERFNEAWKANLKGFDDILALDKLGDDDNPAAARDKDAFVALIADNYFRIQTEAIRKFDPNHLILGCRFAGGNATPAVWAACGRYCDIGTFNYYGSVDLDLKAARGGQPNRFGRPLCDVFREFHELCGRPVMITEYSFPALDAGVPSTKGAGQRFRTQAERAEATGIYAATMLRMPFVVGEDYFMWADEPALGIRPEFPENSNYGLVNEKDEPYPLLTGVFERINKGARELHALGATSVTLEKAQWDNGQLRVELKNGAASAVALTASVTVSSKTQSVDLALPPGEKAEARVPLNLPPGIHVARVTLDQTTLAKARYPGGQVFLEPLVTGSVLAGSPVTLGIYNPSALLPGVIVVSQIAHTFGVDSLPNFLVSLEPGHSAAVVAETGARNGASRPGAMAAMVSSLGPNETKTLELCSPLMSARRPSPPDQHHPALTFDKTANGFVVSNGALTVGSDNATSGLTTAVRAGDLLLGAYNAMIGQGKGRTQFTAADKIESVLPHWGYECLAVDLAGSYGKRKAPAAGEASERAEPFEVCHRLVFFPNRPWFVAQLLWARNTGSEPLSARSWYFRAPSFIRGAAADDRPTSASLVPNLWKGSRASAWLDPKGGFLGAVAPVGGDTTVRFWLDPKGGQHPDAHYDEAAEIAPGATWRPAKAAWVVIAGGPGSEAEWTNLANDLTNMTSARVFTVEKP